MIKWIKIDIKSKTKYVVLPVPVWLFFRKPKHLETNYEI